jgi:hypothetical protein
MYPSSHGRLRELAVFGRDHFGAKNAASFGNCLFFTATLSFLSFRARTRISYLTALTGAAYVVLLKENHMQLFEAATLDRKSGEARNLLCAFRVPQI